MLHILDPLRGLSAWAILLRLVLATLCGGLIGAEREFKRRPAGFRTHILICLGASVTTLTSQYLALDLGYQTDIGRLGAQVIAGIGFIGAGTIIVTRRQHIKGLTTAAGLWTSAIIGLAIGSGFYEVGILAMLLILLAELVFAKWEYALMDRVPEVNLYIEYTDKHALEAILQQCHDLDLGLLNMEFTQPLATDHPAGMILALRMSKKCTAEQLVQQLLQIPHMTLVQLL